MRALCLCWLRLLGFIFFRYTAEQCSSFQYVPERFHRSTRRKSKSSLFTRSDHVTAAMTEASSESDGVFSVPGPIRSPVLRQVYPAMLQHIEKYGNPNIPLGSSDGRMCQTLRRLHTQGKLPSEEVALLEKIGFTWHSLEDVYTTGDFDDLYGRLLQYASTHEGDCSPPKKYPSDPELGAWVTGIRRLGLEQVDPEHAKRLDKINFLWVSDRKCGSAFMKQYRIIQARLEETTDAILTDPGVQQWIQAQREAVARGTLSETRKHYMEELVGEDWLQDA
jgi:hypothetical protein